MNYDELVALLRGPNPGYAEASAAAQAIESLQARVAEVQAQAIAIAEQSARNKDRAERAEADLAAARADAERYRWLRNSTADCVAQVCFDKNLDWRPVGSTLDGAIDAALAGDKP